MEKLATKQRINALLSFEDEVPHQFKTRQQWQV